MQMKQEKINLHCTILGYNAHVYLQDQCAMRNVTAEEKKGKETDFHKG